PHARVGPHDRGGARGVRAADAGPQARTAGRDRSRRLLPRVRRRVVHHRREPRGGRRLDDHEGLTMKITRLATFRIRPRWLFLRVDTDEGIVGWGEPGGEARVNAVEAAIHELADYLVDQNPLKITRLWEVLTKSGFVRGGSSLSSAISGIDHALWDIAGKAYGAPVHELLGGPVRDRMRVYGWIGGDRTGDYGPREIAQEAADQVARGLTAVKMNASSELDRIDRPARTLEIVERAAAVREGSGTERDFAIDCQGRVPKPRARRL